MGGPLRRLRGVAMRQDQEEGKVWEEAKASVGPSGCERPEGLEEWPVLVTEMQRSSVEKENRGGRALGRLMTWKVNGEARSGAVSSPGVTALRAVDEEEVPKEHILSRGMGRRDPQS